MNERLFSLSDDKALGVVTLYIRKIKEIHIYSEYPINEPDLSYHFSTLTSIISNLDVGLTFEKVHTGEEGNSIKNQCCVGIKFPRELDFF